MYKSQNSRHCGQHIQVATALLVTMVVTGCGGGGGSAEPSAAPLPSAPVLPPVEAKYIGPRLLWATPERFIPGVFGLEYEVTFRGERSISSMLVLSIDGSSPSLPVFGAGDPSRKIVRIVGRVSPVLDLNGSLPGSTGPLPFADVTLELPVLRCESVSGRISSNRTLDSSTTPCAEISADVLPGATLTIGPGVLVANSNIRVFGSLLIQGNSSANSYIVASSINPGNQGERTLSLEYVDINSSDLGCGSSGSGNSYSTVQISDSYLRRSGLLAGVTSTSILRNVFDESGPIRSSGTPSGRWEIRNSLFGHARYGVRNQITSSSSTACRDQGPTIVGGIAASASVNPIIKENSFMIRDRTGIGLVNTDVGSVDGTLNYWGASTGPAAQQISDNRRDFSIRGSVLDTPFLSEPAAATPKAYRY